MCGIIGVVSNKPVNQILFDGLTMLQHRGQDAAGITTYDNERFFKRNSVGLVKDVFHTRHMLRLKGNIGLGHVRYPTAGSYSKSEVQPFYVNYGNGITFVHNGNIVNAKEIISFLKDKHVHLNTWSDSEALANLFAFYIHQEMMKEGWVSKDVITRALWKISDRCNGSYSCIAIIAGVGMVAFRDRYGIKPLEICIQRDMNGVLFASEPIAGVPHDFIHLDNMYIRPGTAMFIPFNQVPGNPFIKMIEIDYAEEKDIDFSPCIFEYVYLSRPDSVINGISVSEARKNMGTRLAKKIMAKYNPSIIDIVVPVPDTSIVAASQIAATLGKPYSHGLVKNRYIPRTFIMPEQAIREESIRAKLNVNKVEVDGKNVLVVDDSVVRGTTSKQIVALFRDAGAKKIIFGSLSPPIRFQNVYGIDMPTRSELIANGKTSEEVKSLIGADLLIYQDESDLTDAVNEASKKKFGRFETSIFNGDYITDVGQKYLDELERSRPNAK